MGLFPKTGAVPGGKVSSVKDITTIHDTPHQDPFDVLAAITDHIPNRGQQLVRYFGWYSNRGRGLRKKALIAVHGSASVRIAVAYD